MKLYLCTFCVFWSGLLFKAVLFLVPNSGKLQIFLVISSLGGKERAFQILFLCLRIAGLGTSGYTNIRLY